MITLPDGRRFKKTHTAANADEHGISGIMVYRTNEDDTDLVYERKASFDVRKHITSRGDMASDRFNAQFDKVVEC